MRNDSQVLQDSKGYNYRGPWLPAQLIPKPHTNRRTDPYGCNPEGRMKLLKYLVTEIREENPVPFCVSVKLNSGECMEAGGLSQDEAPEKFRWLVSYGMVDFVGILGRHAAMEFWTAWFFCSAKY
jgi:2,4-dienoyl-CoA reductase-like NADH-dependent reductase (Old Yellow Enzyme family)